MLILRRLHNESAGWNALLSETSKLYVFSRAAALTLAVLWVQDIRKSSKFEWGF